MSLQYDFATLSSFLLVPLAFFPHPDANGRIDLLATGSLGCMTLRLPRTNQMWNRGSTKLQMTRATGQPLEPSLLIVGETFFVRFPQTAPIVVTNFLSDLRGMSGAM